MPTPMSAPEVLDREFLEIRAKLLELAASFDRLDHGEGSVGGDPRMTSIDKALKVLQSSQAGRAETIQLIFSRRYDEQWRATYDLVSDS